jgi:hypothetical protein
MSATKRDDGRGWLDRLLCAVGLKKAPAEKALEDEIKRGQTRRAQTMVMHRPPQHGRVG